MTVVIIQNFICFKSKKRYWRRIGPKAYHSLRTHVRSGTFNPLSLHSNIFITGFLMPYSRLTFQVIFPRMCLFALMTSARQLEELLKYNLSVCDVLLWLFLHSVWEWDATHTQVATVAVDYVALQSIGFAISDFDVDCMQNEIRESLCFTMHFCTLRGFEIISCRMRIFKCLSQ